VCAKLINSIQQKNCIHYCHEKVCWHLAKQIRRWAEIEKDETNGKPQEQEGEGCECSKEKGAEPHTDTLLRHKHIPNTSVWTEEVSKGMRAGGTGFVRVRHCRNLGKHEKTQQSERTQQTDTNCECVHISQAEY
jgi:hypothetical protein